MTNRFDNSIRLLLLCLIMCVAGCDKSDPSEFTFEFEAPGSFSSHTEIKAKQQALLDAYGVHFVSNFSDVFTHFEWTSYNSLDFIPAGESEATSVLEALELLHTVLGDMPQSVIEAMPSYVILADSIAFDCNLVNYENVSDTLFTRQTLMSYSSTNFVALGAFGPSFRSTDKAHATQLWAASILVNYLLSLPAEQYPQEFYDYAIELQGGKGYDANCTGSYFPLSVYPAYNMETYGCFDHMFRSLSTYYGYFMGADGAPYRLTYDTYMTVYIDLACHLSFALYGTEQQRNYYENHPTADGAFTTKQQLALEYAERVLDWNINI